MATAPDVTTREERPLLGAALISGTANVIMQLAHQPVGYGVVDSPVKSGSIMHNPQKRTRTTLTYLAVALKGTDQEKRAYRKAVNRSHAQVRSGPDDPVQYNAFDPELQLWVAACLYKGVEDAHEAFVGALDDETRRELYEGSAQLGTTLQVRDDMWPADRAAFEEYWEQGLARIHIDDKVRAFLTDLVDMRFAHRPVQLLAGRFHRFMTIGFLAPPFREQMRLTWTPKQQRRFERVLSVMATLIRFQPRAVREFPFNLYLRDMRRRIRTGQPLV